MATMDTATDTLRERTLEIAKRHKASWIELGQHLYTIHRDRLFKQWGYLEFDTYCRKELHIKDTTALKLLRSYQFLEKEEPRFVRSSFAKEAKTVPDYESVNLLRLAKNNKQLSESDFSDLKESVLEGGQDPKDVRVQVRKLLSEREVKDPAEARRDRRNAILKRLITFLTSQKNQLQSERFVPDYVIKQMTDLSEKLQAQLE